MRKRAGRYAVEIAGVVLAPVSVEMIAESQLVVGREVDQSTLDRLIVAARQVACFDRALEALARRSRSARDLERWLRDRDFSTAEIAPALDRLAELGMLDDLAFARGFAHSRAVGRGFGLRRVAAELGRHGVANAVVATVLTELRERHAGGEQAALEAAAQKRARALGKLEPEVARRRLMAWLVRRGFALGDAAGAARRALARR